MRDYPSQTAGATPPRLQRSSGVADVKLSARGGRARIDRLAQSGSAKAFLPRVYGTQPEVVFLNTSGGLTGGDTLRYSIDVTEGALTATTQTAERAYASPGGLARLDVDLRVGAGTTLHWLPQETILFDRSALARRTRAELAGDASLVMLETVILGRAAMGERVARLDFTDWREVRVGGKPVLIDPLRLTTRTLVRAGAPSVLGDAIALSTLAVVGPGAEAALATLRAALHPLPETVSAAASAWSGKLVVRALSRDAFDLRKVMARLVPATTGSRLPSVWAM